MRWFLTSPIFGSEYAVTEEGPGKDGGWGKGVGGYVRGGGAYWQPDWPAHTPPSG